MSEFTKKKEILVWQSNDKRWWHMLCKEWTIQCSWFYVIMVLSFCLMI